MNGEKTQEYVDATGAMVKVENHDLAIGCGSSKYADDDSNYDNDHIIPASDVVQASMLMMILITIMIILFLLLGVGISMEN
ncbi:MAG: hypothetical protein B7C24_02725 [Bacteroidetes bacterium 4572_77]|nr:MAG: hypothetical protein B7C24_02725 [Bacteroidetes bacterium 4572_77]